MFKGLLAGEEKTWSLPDIVENGSFIKTINVEPDNTKLKGLITFDEDSNTLTFSASEEGLSLAGKTYYI